MRWVAFLVLGLCKRPSYAWGFEAAVTRGSAEVGSEHFQLAVARLLGVLDAVAEVVELSLYGETALLVIDLTAEIADQPVDFVLVEQDRLNPPAR